MMTESKPQNPPRGRGLVLLLASFFGLFAALCTVFVLVMTAALAWQEHTEAQWPATSARVVQCSLDIYTHKPDSYWIDCTIRYTIGSAEIVTHVHSRTSPAPRRVIAQYLQGQFEKMQDWVDAHPQGTPIAVHYDPANQSKAVLVATDMPLGGPQTPGSLKLLGITVSSCVILLTIARIARQPSAAMN